jgi:hypothetical protein
MDARIRVFCQRNAVHCRIASVVYRVMGTTGTNSVGDNVCFDGSLTNQSCGAIIQQARVCENIDDGLTGVFTDLSSFQQTFGGGVQIDQ